MAEEFDHDQRELAQLWKRARKDGCMPPWQQAKVFGLKEAWEEMHGDKTYGQLKWIAERVYVQGHPKRLPNHEAVRQLLHLLIISRLLLKNNTRIPSDPSRIPSDFLTPLPRVLLIFRNSTEVGSRRIPSRIPSILQHLLSQMRILVWRTYSYYNSN